MPNASSMPGSATPEPKNDPSKDGIAKPKPQVLIAVMGLTDSGKSTFVKLASGSGLRVGQSMVSCDSTIDFTKPFHLDDREITLYDTPEFNDTKLSDTEFLSIIAGELEQQYNILRSILKNHPVPLDFQNELVDVNRPIDKTSAGAAVDKKLAELSANYEQKLEEHMGAVIKAQKEREDETRQRLLEEALKTREAMAKLEVERKNQAKEYELLRNQLAEMKAERRRERERQETVQKAKDTIAKVEAERLQNKLAELEERQKREAEQRETAQKAKDTKAKAEAKKLREELTESEAKRHQEAARHEAALKAKDAKSKAEADTFRQQLAELEETHKKEAEEQARRIVTRSVKSGRLHRIRSTDDIAIRPLATAKMNTV